MAVLETIRVKFGILITVLIAVALLSFIIDPSSLNSLTSDYEDESVGEINGEQVTYTEFHNAMQMYNDMYGKPNNAELADQMRAMVWNSFLNEKLYVTKAKEAGFNVSEEELYQLLSGKMFSQVIYSNFRGQMTPEYLVEILEDVKADETGAAQMVWDNIVKFTEYDKYIQKYSDYLVKSSFSNSLLAENEIANSNNVFNVEFVMVPFGFSRDTTITVSDEEIKAFYDNNKNLFKQEETRDIEYVVIEATPTAEDVEAVKAAFDEVYADFATTESVEAILSVNSEYKNSAWCKAGDLKFISEEAEAYAFSKGATVSEVFADDKAYHAVRVLDAAGDSVKVAVLYKTINPSQETLDTYYAKAENILNKAENIDMFNQAAIEEGYFAHPLNNMLMNAKSLGSVNGTDAITKWAFNAEKGEVSKIYTIGNYNIIAAVKDINHKGYASLDKVRSFIDNRLYQEKAADKKLAEVAEKVNGLTDLEAVAEALGTAVNTKENVTFASFDLDPKFVGAASVAQEGVVSAPFKGTTGIYVFKVTGRSEGAYFTDDDAEASRMQMNSMYMQMLPYVLNMAGNVTDNTPLYF